MWFERLCTAGGLVRTAHGTATSGMAELVFIVLVVWADSAGVVGRANGAFAFACRFGRRAPCSASALFDSCKGGRCGLPRFLCVELRAVPHRACALALAAALPATDCTRVCCCVDAVLLVASMIGASPVSVLRYQCSCPGGRSFSRTDAVEGHQLFAFVASLLPCVCSHQ